MTAIPIPLDHKSADAHAHSELHAHPHKLSFIKKYIFSTDHKVIGLQFLFLGLFFLVIGGLLAMLVRWHLAWPNTRIPDFRPIPILSSFLWGGKPDQPAPMSNDFYNAAFSMHASLMIFLVIIPLLVGAFGNYLIPLKIGAADMAFPFLNGAVFWIAVPAGLLMTASFFFPGGPAQAGWTSYPTLSELPLNSDSDKSVLPPNFEQVATYLRLHDAGFKNANGDNSWPSISLFLVGGGLLLCFLFICAYQVHLGFRPLNWLVSLVVSAALAWASLLLFQFLASDGQSAWFFSLFLLGFSSILGALNYLTTIVKLRAPGMTFFRMPLSVWSLFVTSLMVLLATPVLAAALFMNLLDHHRWTSFFIPYNWVVSDTIQMTASNQMVSGGGYPILHQHLFWFYSHPAVYIMILPAMGMVSDIMAVFSRKPIFGYRPMIYAMAAIALLGFVVWAHHMFQSGMNPALGNAFAVSTMLIAVPSAIKTFNWLGTLWRGNIQFKTPMLHAITFVSMFVIGGLSGIFMASPFVDVQIHDTYFIVAHIHYVLFGGSIFGLFAAITFWYPKMFGRMMNETVGKIHWALTFIFFHGTFFPMHILGIRGMARRLADYTSYSTFKDLVSLNQFITWCALGMGAVQVLFALNFIGSWIFGKKAGRNPWKATTLEWETASPPPHGNFEKTPVVYHGPYEYSSPLSEEDWLPQTRKLDGGGTAPAH